MTFQEAQGAFSNLVSNISLASSSGELRQKQLELGKLLNDLPNRPEFDPIARAIAEFSPRLAGMVTGAVLADLQSRDATLKDTSALLAQVSTKAAAEARSLTFEKPALVAAALTESVSTLNELRAAAKAKDFESVAAKAEALVTLVESVRASIKAA